MDQRLDLVLASREHLALLRAVHLSDRQLYARSSDLELSIQAYLKIWLPSLDHNGDVDDAPGPPPLEVAWVWHLHKLDPVSYQRDCIQWYGRLVDAREDICPFCFADTLQFPNQVSTDTDSEFIERISACAKRQSTLLWQLCWPEYEDPVFLKESVDRYKMMLELMRQNPDQFIVPTYDIDNIWHTHLAYPGLYLECCQQLVGRHVGHDDSVNDRSDGSKLRLCTATTERLWNDAFRCPWRRDGGMFRGEPPTWYWSHRSRAAGPCPAQGPRPTVAQGVESSRFVEVVGFAFGAASEPEVSTSFARFACTA